MTSFIVLGVLILIVFYIIGLYNQLVKLKNGVENAWAQIDVQLKRRHDLIPNLIETVKGYVKHERETLESVTKLRQQAINVTGNIAEQVKIESMLSQTLKSLFAVAENYPDLKANQNFLALQSELGQTEDKISYARQFYNEIVLVLNNKIQMFPSNIMANMFNFKLAAFFEIINPEEKQTPQVKF